MSQTLKQTQPVSIYQSLLAGAIAGGVEATITYPTEYVKTQLQLQSKKTASSQVMYQSPWDCAVKTVKEKGVKGIYRGLSALITGTAAKAAIRFFSFEEFKKILADDQGHLSSSKRLLAGLGAGVSEGILVVTPTETIKTKLIQDQNRAQPQYKGLLHGNRLINFFK
jgi:solute carrier family 25 citrate transporter 1